MAEGKRKPKRKLENLLEPMQEEDHLHSVRARQEEILEMADSDLQIQGRTDRRRY